MATKICKQCGEIKPLEQFRRYYGGRKGTYTTCILCEKLNSREKYLASKSSLTETESIELEKIHALWQAQTTLGLRPPKTGTRTASPITENLDDMLAKYTAASQKVGKISTDAPQQPELLKWLTEPLTEEPEYYQEEIYENLKKKYRPTVRIDKETMMPVYDDTYRDLLLQIAARFDEYEDTYYAKE